MPNQLLALSGSCQYYGGLLTLRNGGSPGVKLKCFIASAFDWDDVDAIYDKVVKKLLREMDIQPLRVNRTEHNDDIDDKIMELLDASDLCIADLTYARPSVYYEAGYAFASGKPVIYIARGDHSRPRDDDEHGNRKIHFDLQMKNIIWWTSPNEAFRQRLKSRLNHVLRPLLRQRALDSQKREAESAFYTLPMYRKSEGIIEAGKAILERLGFLRFDGQELRFADSAFRYKLVGGKYQQVVIVFMPALKKKEFQDWMQYYMWRDLDDGMRDSIKKSEHYVFFCTLGSISRTTLASWLKWYSHPFDGIFGGATTSQKLLKVPNVNFVVAVDRIKSVEQFNADFVLRLGQCDLAES